MLWFPLADAFPVSFAGPSRRDNVSLTSLLFPPLLFDFTMSRVCLYLSKDPSVALLDGSHVVSDFPRANFDAALSSSRRFHTPVFCSAFTTAAGFVPGYQSFYGAGLLTPHPTPPPPTSRARCCFSSDLYAETYPAVVDPHQNRPTNVAPLLFSWLIKCYIALFVTVRRSHPEFTAGALRKPDILAKYSGPFTPKVSLRFLSILLRHKSAELKEPSHAAYIS